MLFVAEYELTWESMEAVVAKRIEWDDAKPDGFRFIGEYVWADRDPPFRGVAIIETDSVEALNSFVLHYGPSLKIRVHAASDVVSAITAIGAGRRPVRDRPRKRKPR